MTMDEDKYWRHSGGKNPRLTDDNWFLWNSKVKIALRSEGLLDIATGKTKRPEDLDLPQPAAAGAVPGAANAAAPAPTAEEITVNRKKQETWDEKNNNAFGILANAISTSLQTIANDYETAWELYEYLQKRYDLTINTSGRITIQRNLSSLSQQKGESATAMVQRAMTMYNQLSGTTERPAEDSMKHYLVNGLNSDWTETAMRWTENDTMTLDSIVQNISRLETTMKEKKASLKKKDQDQDPEGIRGSSSALLSSTRGGSAYRGGRGRGGNRGGFQGGSNRGGHQNSGQQDGQDESCDIHPGARHIKPECITYLYGVTDDSNSPTQKFCGFHNTLSHSSREHSSNYAQGMANPSASSSPQTGNNNRFNPYNRPESPRNPNITCFNCGKPGHIMRFCPELRGTGGNQQQSTALLTDGKKKKKKKIVELSSDEEDEEIRSS